MFEAGHSLCSRQHIPCVRSRTFLVLRTREFVCSSHQQCSCHFLVNSTYRPRILANRNQIRPNSGTIGRIRQKMTCKISNFERLKNREDSSDFDDFLTKMIASTRSIFWKTFARPKNFRVDENIRFNVRFDIDLMVRRQDYRETRFQTRRYNM